jgi:hypothetical protein
MTRYSDNRLRETAGDDLRKAGIAICQSGSGGEPCYNHASIF